MSSDEIRALEVHPEAGDTNELLREIAYQLARFYELIEKHIKD